MFRDIIESIKEGWRALLCPIIVRMCDYTSQAAYQGSRLLQTLLLYLIVGILPFLYTVQYTIQLWCMILLSRRLCGVLSVDYFSSAKILLEAFSIVLQNGHDACAKCEGIIEKALSSWGPILYPGGWDGEVLLNQGPGMIWGPAQLALSA